MRALLRHVVASATAAVLTVAFAPPASADPNARECIAAADRGQVLQRGHNLTMAREAFRVCAAPSCPAEVQRACIGWLDTADKAQPTLAFNVTDSNNVDIADVHVTVDGNPFVSKLLGTAVEIDPGEHAFRFVAPGYVSLTRKVVIVEGEKMRRVHVVLDKVGGNTPAPVVGAVAPVPRSASAPPPEAPPETRAPPETSTAQKTAGVILLATGSASIATGIGFLIDYVIQETNLNAAAVNNYDTHSSKTVTNPCETPTAVNAETQAGCVAQGNAQIAEIVQIGTFSAGGALAIIGISLIATAPSPPPRAYAAAATPKTGLDWHLVPTLSPQQTGLMVVGRW
jgi:hypothetical protein